MLSKAYAINCSCFAKGAQSTLHKQKKKELTKINHPWPYFLAPCYSEFTCAILSTSSISRLTIAHMWSNGVGAVCIFMTRVLSFTLVNVYEITDKKKWDFKIMQKLRCISHNCVKECRPWLFSTFCWIARTRDSHTLWKKLVYAKTYLLITSSQVTVSPILKKN